MKQSSRRVTLSVVLSFITLMSTASFAQSLKVKGVIISRAGTPVAKVVPLTRTVNRTARGSLRGKLVLSPDWDSSEVNEL